MISLKSVFLTYISAEDIDEFSVWAFGEDVKNYTYGEEFRQAWNDLHSDKLVLKSDGYVAEDAKIIAKLWKEKWRYNEQKSR